MPALPFLRSEIRQTTHRDGDDLLSAGLGLAGLRGNLVEAADPAAPTAAELRRRAIQQNWRGIVDLSPTGGFGQTYGAVPDVPGRELQAFAALSGARQPHRLLAQIPDHFDPQRRCLVVSPVSGSRGVYGAIGVGGAWGLPKGCAVVYTDKGAGTGFFDLASQEGVALDGRRARRGETALEFDPGPGPQGFESGWPGVAFKHAHSGDNPEAGWGLHTLQALQFGLHALDLAFPEQAPFTPDNTVIIGLGISNGGGALLRAAEADQEGWFDAVIAGEPNIVAPGSAPLIEYTMQAALYQPCAWLALPNGPALAAPEQLRAAALQRCASLHAAGLLSASEPDDQAAEALSRLQAGGWEPAALSQMGVLMAIDVWRTVLATYLQAYAQADVYTPQCGYRFAVLGPERQPLAASAAARAAWWTDASGVPPSAGVALLDGLANGADPALPGLLCAREQIQRPEVRAAIEATRGTARPQSSRVAIVHGQADGLIPMAFSSRPYARAANAQGHVVR
ncbi:MAG: hydrogenase, partial [Xanthomonadales bacterium]|nr:hydrogenase [Xanthomonadales bacterium]